MPPSDTPEVQKRKKEIVTSYLSNARYVGGRDKLFEFIRYDHSDISRRDIARILATDVVHETHKPLNKRTTMKQIIVRGPAIQGQADLIDMQKMSGANRNVRYLLTYVDIFSKYSQIRALKNKTTIAVTAAMKDILDDMPASWRPRTLQLDNGAEFKQHFEDMLSTYGIKKIHSLAYSPATQGSVERYNRQVKSAIFSLMDRNKTSSYLEYLEPLIENFNTSIHGTTGYRPLDIMESMPLSDEMISFIQDRMRTRVKHTVQGESLFDVGDIVRVALTTEAAVRRDKFRKKISANWSTGVFEVYSVSEPTTAGTQRQYLLKNLETNRKSIKRYWAFQLQNATIPESESESESEDDNDEILNDPQPVRPRVEPHDRPSRVRAPSAAQLNNIVANSYW
jgi:transposase InsO family protein